MSAEHKNTYSNTEEYRRNFLINQQADWPSDQFELNLSDGRNIYVRSNDDHFISCEMI